MDKTVAYMLADKVEKLTTETQSYSQLHQFENNVMRPAAANVEELDYLVKSPNIVSN